VDRRAFLGTVAGGLLATPLAAGAQPAGKVWRIGYLSNVGCPIRPEIMGPFRQGLRELGYVEGQNIIIECRAALGATDRVPGFAAELVRVKVDVLVAQGTASALAAKQAHRSRRRRRADRAFAMIPVPTGEDLRLTPGPHSLRGSLV